MTKPIEINQGEVFAVSDKVILVREYEAVLARGSKLGVSAEEDQILYAMTFKGKLNNKERSGDVTIMMSPQDAFEHAKMIMGGIQFLVDYAKGGTDGG